MRRKLRRKSAPALRDGPRSWGALPPATHTHTHRFACGQVGSF